MKVISCECGNHPAYVWNEPDHYEGEKPVYQGICDDSPAVHDEAERGQFRKIPRNAHVEVIARD